MAHNITRIRSRITLLFGVTTVVLAVALVLVNPVVCDLTPRAVRSEQLNMVIFGSLFLAGMIVTLTRYLRPISDLGYALEMGSTPTAELARQARRIAFNAPVRFLVLPVVGVLATAVLANVFGILVWPDYTWGVHFPSTLLTTATSACGSLVVSLISRQLMRPVLLYTAAHSQTDGYRLSVRKRLFLATLPLVVTAVSFTSILGYTQVARAYREQVADAVLLSLQTAVESIPRSLPPEQMLGRVVEGLSGTEYEYVFLVDDDGHILAQRPDADDGLAFDSELWLREPSTRFRQATAYFVLTPAPFEERWWVGVGYVVHPVRSVTVIRTVVALSVSGVILLVLAAVVSHYLAADLVIDLRDVTARLSSAAREKRVDLAPLIPILSQDEVGDLARAYNALQERVQAQQEQVEYKQRQLIALQSLSYKIGTARDVNQLLQEVVRDVERAFGYHNVSLLLVDDERAELYFAVANHVDTVLRDRTFKIGQEGVVGHVAATGKPLLVNDVSICEFYIADRTNTRSEMAVPLIVGEKVIGVFNVSSERIGAFDESDLHTVTALASQVATAVENARLFDGLRAQKRKLARLARQAEVESQRMNIGESR